MTSRLRGAAVHVEVGMSDGVENAEPEFTGASAVGVHGVYEGGVASVQPHLWFSSTEVRAGGIQA